MARNTMPFVLGFFQLPEVFRSACRASTAAGHRGQEAFTPYPVHGLERVLGFRRSWIGRPVLFMLLFGAFLGFMMQYWMLKWSWPVIIGGKPFNSWPAFVVITFECGILSGALLNFVLILFVACKIFPNTRTTLPSDALTDDHFCLAVPITEHGSLEALKTWMKDQGAEKVEIFVPDGAISESTVVTPVSSKDITHDHA